MEKNGGVGGEGGGVGGGFFFFQAEDGIRDWSVTGVQTCALPIWVLIEKVGEELANQVFEMAAKLESNPNGDFAVAYLMRRFDGD